MEVENSLWQSLLIYKLDKKGVVRVIEKKTVEHIAQLARLEVSEDEKESFTKDLGSILTHIKQLDEADTDGVEPTSFMIPEHDSMRDDVVKESLSIDKALENGPSTKKGFFAVPKIIN